MQPEVLAAAAESQDAAVDEKISEAASETSVPEPVAASTADDGKVVHDGGRYCLQSMQHITL